jgi:hypothetical protein
MEGSGRYLIYCMYYTGTCLKGLRKHNENSSRNSGSPDRDLNPGHPEQEEGILTFPQREPVVARNKVFKSLVLR